MYHSIAIGGDDPYCVSPAAFVEQLAWLRRQGFEVVPLSFVSGAIKAGKRRTLRRKVVITFDDGCEDFLANALPVLLDHGYPATVFLVTDMLGGQASWNESGAHVRLMSEADARYVKKHGISLGSHTATHADLTRLSDQRELQRQLTGSRDTLTSLGETFYAFSYPWGQWSWETITAVRDSGYECAVAVGEQTRVAAADVYRLPRITMTYDMDMSRFASRLTRTKLEKELRRRYRNLWSAGLVDSPRHTPQNVIR